MRAALIVAAAAFWTAAAAVAYRQGNHGWAWLMLVWAAIVALLVADDEK